MMRKLGCALGLLLLILGIAGTAAVWLVASALGIVSTGTFARLLSVAALGLGGLAVAGAVVATRRLAAPADRLVEASRQIEAGDFTARVPVRGPTDLRSLARAFNAMSSRLEATEARRRSVVAEVAHELRTPLSIIRGQAEAICDGVYAASPERMSPILDSVSTLEVLVDDLATLGLAEAGGLRLRREAVDIDELVHDSVDAHLAAAQTAGISLLGEVAAGLYPADADPARIRSVLANLVSNALRHTPSGGHVRIVARMAPDGEMVELAVIDDGEGIPAALLPHVLDRFVKGPNSPGSGLGLAIVRDVVEAHGGEVDVTSTEGRGTTVTVRLPVATATRD
jgi:two-component system sensor histidine kinase BaeS